MNIRIYYVHPDGITYTADTFPSSAANAIWGGAQAASDVLENRNLGGLAWNVNLLSTPIAAAKQKEGFSGLQINSLPVLVFQRADNQVVLGVLQSVTLANVRDSIAAMVQAVYATAGDNINTDGSAAAQPQLPFPESFLPIGLFKGPGWNLRLPAWAWLILGGVSTYKLSESSNKVGQVLWGSNAAFSLLNYSKARKS